MNKYRLFADSTSDLPQEYLQENNVEIIPLSYTLNGAEYMEELDQAAKKRFYELMRGGAHPVTSQVNAERFIERWAQVMEEGYDIVHIVLSSGLSGTYNSAAFAKQVLEERYPERSVYVVDSLGASLGEGLLVVKAIEKRDAGFSAADLAEYLENNKLYIHHWFTVDDLIYLRRGGRVSATAAFVGSLLNIKPVLHVNSDGKLIPLERVKGRKKSLTYLFERFKEFAVDKAQLIGISHADCLDDAKMLESMIRNASSVKDVLISNIGAVIGSHAGPGTVALFFFGPKRVLP